MTTIVDISIAQLLATYVFLLVLLYAASRLNPVIENQILIGSLRMTAQLAVMGYVLIYLFEVDHWLLSLGVLLLMEVFAVWTIYGRMDSATLNRGLRRVVALALAAGTLSVILYLLIVVIRVTPWYQSRYLITIAGMVIGNSMTGITLGAERLAKGFKTRRDLIEGALMLGAEPQSAARDVINEAFTAAVLPTINSMVGMGIIFLPGMMTGQILSGVSPLIAIKYQLVIMLGITGSVTLTVVLLLGLGYKTFFTDRAQLR